MSSHACISINFRWAHAVLATVIRLRGFMFLIRLATYIANWLRGFTVMPRQLTSSIAISFELVWQYSYIQNSYNGLMYQREAN